MFVAVSPTSEPEPRNLPEPQNLVGTGTSEPRNLPQNLVEPEPQVLCEAQKILRASGAHQSRVPFVQEPRNRNLELNPSEPDLLEPPEPGQFCSEPEPRTS